MRVAVVMPGFHVLLHSFCEYLTKAGFEVTLFLPKEKIQLPNTPNYKILTLPSISVTNSMPFSPFLLKYVSRKYFDVILFGEDFQINTLIFSVYSFLRKVPFVIINEKYFFSRISFLRPLHKLVQRTIIRYFVWHFAAAIITHSTAAKRFIIKNRAPTQKVFFIPVGVDSSFLNIDCSKVKKHTKPKQQYNILTVARLIEHKGLPYLIDAIDLLIKKNYRVHLTIVGDGPLKDVIEEMIEKMGLRSNVTFIPYVSHRKMPYIYCQNDIFVLPSVIEVVGVSAIEAMACGLPLVLTKVGGLKDLVINNRNGVLVESRNAKALYKALKYLLDNPSELKKMASESKYLARLYFSWDNLILKYAKIIKMASGTYASNN